MSSGPDSTRAAIAARRKQTQDKLAKVEKAICQLRRERGRLTIRAIAERAGVSATFLYENTDARTLVKSAVTDSHSRHDRLGQEQHDRIEATWRERALNAEAELTRTQKEVFTQRKRIGEIMGQLSDFDQMVPGESVQQLSTENTTLKHRVQHLTREHRSSKALAPTSASRRSARLNWRFRCSNSNKAVGAMLRGRRWQESLLPLNNAWTSNRSRYATGPPSDRPGRPLHCGAGFLGCRPRSHDRTRQHRQSGRSGQQLNQAHPRMLVDLGMDRTHRPLAHRQGHGRLLRKSAARVLDVQLCPGGNGIHEHRRAVRRPNSALLPLTPRICQDHLGSRD
jgi:hypothetical protein